MRWPGILFLGLALVLPARAEDWTTEDGKTYKNVTVLNQEDDGVRITYAGGAGKIPYYELPVDIQKRFGQDVDSLAAKKKAIDAALEDAVRSAIAAEQMKQPKEATPAQPTPTPPPANNGNAPGTTSPANSGSETQPGNAAVTPAPGNTTPGNSATPGTAQNNNGTPDNNNNAPGNTAPGNNASPTATAPGPTTPHGQPGVAPNGNAPGGGGQPGVPGGPRNDNMPALNDYVPGRGGGAGTSEGSSPYPGSKVTYNSALDLCYLDSPPIDLIPVAPASPKAVKQTASLTLRIVTEGHKPEAPEKIEATYLLVGGANQSTADSPISFKVDDKSIALDDSAKKDSSTMGSGGQTLFYMTFYLTPEQLKTISHGQNIELSVSPVGYQLDAAGVAYLQAYQKDLDVLPASTSSLLRSYYKMLARIPSFVSMISTFCEYLILGSFALLVCASIAAFVMGITRFIKM